MRSGDRAGRPASLCSLRMFGVAGEAIAFASARSCAPLSKLVLVRFHARDLDIELQLIDRSNVVVDEVLSDRPFSGLFAAARS